MNLNWLNKDAVSGFAKKATDILFIKNPVATSMGVMFGFFIHLIVSAIKPLWEDSKVVNFSNIPVYSYLFSGIFICNAVALLFLHFRRRGFSPDIEKTIALIKHLEHEGKLTKAQARLKYMNLIEKVLRDLEVKTPPDDASGKNLQSDARIRF